MFVRSAPFVKTTREWAALAPRCRTAQGGARAAAHDYARRNMVAIVMRADDSAVSYLFDAEGDRVVRTSHPKVEWVA